MAHVAVCVTAPSHAEVEAIGRALIEARLAASVNIVPGVSSVYWWDGAVRETDEAMLWAKTRADLVEPLTTMVKAMHSYDWHPACPISAPDRRRQPRSSSCHNTTPDRDPGRGPVQRLRPSPARSTTSSASTRNAP